MLQLAGFPLILAGVYIVAGVQIRVTAFGTGSLTEPHRLKSVLPVTKLDNRGIIFFAEVYQDAPRY